MHIEVLSGRIPALSRVGGGMRSLQHETHPGITYMTNYQSNIPGFHVEASLKFITHLLSRAEYCLIAY